MNTVTEVLQACTIHGNSIKLPPVQLERNLYLEVKNTLEKIGGKWKGGKTAAFIFREDPTEPFSDIANGKKRNIKKELQFFETPPELADRLAELACISDPDLSILEPSAGQGAIIHALLRKEPRLNVHCYELHPAFQAILQSIESVDVMGADFLTSNSSLLYDRIVANPPFSKNQDIDHITAMYARLKPGGRLVSIASMHCQFADGTKEKQFRSWVSSLDSQVIELEDKTFRSSGTSASAIVIVIDK